MTGYTQLHASDIRHTTSGHRFKAVCSLTKSDEYISAVIIHVH